MQKDYRHIWTTWLTSLNLDLARRKKLLDSLHVEVTKGFDVITRIAREEMEEKVVLDPKVQEELESSIAFSVWSGYLMSLVDKNIDPLKENLLAETSTNELGNQWVTQYTKDQNKSLLMEIDPLVSIILESGTDSQLNQLFLFSPELTDKSYKEIGIIEQFHNWAAHQGYIVGLLEQKLRTPHT